MIQLNDNDPEVRRILDDPTLDTEQRWAALQQLKEEKRYAADDGKITPAQQVFINEMIKGANQAQAYRIAYPGTSDASVYSSASRLMDRPSIQRRIEEGIIQAHTRRLRDEKEKLTKKLQSIIDKREVLDDIIHGRRIGKTTTANKDTGTTFVKFKEDPMLAIQAIKLDLKLEELQEKLEDELKGFPEDDEDEGSFLNAPAESGTPDPESASEKKEMVEHSATSKNKKRKKPCETLANRKNVAALPIANDSRYALNASNNNKPSRHGSTSIDPKDPCSAGPG